MSSDTFTINLIDECRTAVFNPVTIALSTVTYNKDFDESFPLPSYELDVGVTYSSQTICGSKTVALTPTVDFLTYDAISNQLNYVQKAEATIGTH